MSVMEADPVLRNVRTTMAQALCLPVTRIAADADLRADLHLGIFDLLELGTRLEETFGLQLPYNALMHARTPRDVAAHVSGLLGAARAA